MIDFDELVNGPCCDTFGEPVTYTPNGQDPFYIEGIFNAAHTVISGDGYTEISSVQPVLDVRLSDVPAGVEPSIGDTLVIAGVTYKVSDTQADGSGMVKLMLHRRG